MTSKFNLRKNQVINLKKQIGLGDQKAEVVLIMDKSGSMDWLYKNGFVTRTCERLFPLALAFDDDGEMPLIGFHNSAKKVLNVTESNFDQIIPELNKLSWGGTYYEKPLNIIKEDYSNKKTGIMGMFSKSSQKRKYPVYVMFITDGNNDDQAATERIIKELATAPVYIQFVGIGNAKFSFLEKLDDLSGRERDNCGFFQANDLDKLSDTDLYSLMLKEFPAFVSECKQSGLIE